MPRYKLSPIERAAEQERKENLRNIMKGLDVKNFDDLKGVFKMMVGEMLENGLDGELEDELGYTKYDCRNKEGENSSMLLKLSNGAIAKISENRRIAWNTPETFITSFNGTKASYECSLMQHSYLKMDSEGSVDFEDVSDLLNPFKLTKHKNDPDYSKNAVNGTWGSTEAPIQACSRLPEEFENLHTGHAGTHKFMIDDFCQAYLSRTACTDKCVAGGKIYSSRSDCPQMRYGGRNDRRCSGFGRSAGRT